jgi:hypothetical protein
MSALLSALMPSMAAPALQPRPAAEAQSEAKVRALEIRSTWMNSRSEAQAADYRKELKVLPPNELSRLVKETALAEEEELRLRREREEK